MRVLNSKTNIKKIIALAKIAPVLVTNFLAEDFGKSTLIKSTVPSKNLGIVTTEKGVKIPKWLSGIIKGTESPQIVIENIDEISKENQEKFYELLKYKTISGIDLPKNCYFIVTATDLNNVSKTILSLCQIVM